MKLSKKQIRKLIETCVNPDGSRKKYNTATGEPCDGPPPPTDSELNQEFESPIADKIKEDDQKQDAVMQAEEERYGLPFTNRDIRLLLLSYVDKIQEISASGDNSILSQINSRVLNYIKNLQIKINNGTAAYPAYSNKVDQKLSMFYYQTPDIGQTFKGFARDILRGNFPSGIDTFMAGSIKETLRSIIMQANPSFAEGTKKYDMQALIEALEKTSSYTLLQLANSITSTYASAEVMAMDEFNVFSVFRNQTLNPSHGAELTKRIYSSKKAIERFQKAAEMAANVSEMGSEDVGYQGSDLIEDFLAELDSLMTGQNVSNFPAFHAVQQHAMGPLYDAMDNADFRDAYKQTRKLIRLIQQCPHGQAQLHNDSKLTRAQAKEKLIAKAQPILSYVDTLRFDIKKYIPQLVRSIRASMEGFQSLFENNRRNKMKLNRKQLRKMIMERVMMYDDGTDSLTKPRAAAMSLIDKMTNLIVQQAQSDHSAGNPVAFGSFREDEVKKRMATNVHKAFLGGFSPEQTAMFMQHFQAIDPESYTVLKNERDVSYPTLTYALTSILKDLGIAPNPGPYSFDDSGL